MRTILPLLILFSAHNANGADVPSLMKKIVDLRAELESMSRETDSIYKEKQGELDLWTSKRTELQANLQKETLRQLHLTEKNTRLAERVKLSDKADPKGKTLLLSWLEEARLWVHHSLPFRQTQRLETLAELKGRTERGLESLEALSAELWQFYETEMKLAADNEYRLLDGMEVARVGFFALYTRDALGTIKKAKRTNGTTWDLMAIDDATERASTEKLIDNLKAKKDSGLYTLPFSRSESL